MSKTVGHLSPFTGQQGEQGFKGDLTFHHCRGQIALRPNMEKRSDRSPDYTVLVDREGAGRGWQEYGLAWDKEPEDKPAYVSILLNHESLQQDFNLAAFPPFNEEEDERWVIVYGRPRGGRVAETAAATIATAQSPF